MRAWRVAGWTPTGCDVLWRLGRCRGRRMAGWCWRSMSPAGCVRRRIPRRSGSCAIPTDAAKTPTSWCPAGPTRSSWRWRPAAAPGPRQPGDREILLVADAGYDGPRLAFLLADLPVVVLVRMRSDRVLRRSTPARLPGTMGRPRRHGDEFVFGDPATWSEPDVTTRTDTRLYGPALARAWNRLHPRLTHRTAWTTHLGKLPIIEGTVIRLEVDRLPSGAIPKPVWLWHSATDLDATVVDLLWQAFLRRFDIEHTFRMLKQTLGWTTPKLRTPEQGDRWTWLLLAAYTQLRLARDLTADLRPLGETARPGRLTPARVHRGFRHLRTTIGTPASAPKPTRPGPGRPTGQPNQRPAPRHDVHIATSADTPTTRSSKNHVQHPPTPPNTLKLKLVFSDRRLPRRGTGRSRRGSVRRTARCARRRSTARRSAVRPGR